MKWLVLFPAWVFLASYIIYRVKEANRTPEEVPAAGTTDGAGGGADVPPAAEPVRERRPAELDGAEMERRAQSLAGRVHLVPRAGGSVKPGLSPLLTPDEFDRVASSSGARASFDRWRLVELEWVSFMVPDESFAVEIRPGTEPLPMVAPYYHRVDQRPDRWVRVASPDGQTWCALAIDGARQFDSEERYPEPEPFHKLLLAGGGAMRASVGVAGVLRRVQWLGGSVRVSLLDWQHGTAHADAYLAFAAGVRLAEELPEGRLALGRLAGSAGLESRMGLLERGMPKSAVEALLGRPVGVAGEHWVYHVPARDGDRYYRVPFVQEQFPGFQNGWREIRRDPPIEGSIAWMREKTSFAEGAAGGVGYDLGVLTDEEVEQIFGEIRQALPHADADDWREYCEVLANMAEMGLKDEGAMEVLRRRFLEQALRPCRPAVRVLIASGAGQSAGLFVEKAKSVLQDARSLANGPGANADVLDELEMLFGALGGDALAGQELISLAAKHPVAAVRALGYSHWRLLGDDGRLPLLRSGMDDEAAVVRRRCAEALSVACENPADRPMLDSLLRVETDAETRDHLERAIAGIGGEASP